MIPLRRVDGRPEIGKVQAAIEVLAVRKRGVLVEYRDVGNVISGVGIATFFLPKVVRPPNEDVAGVGNGCYRGTVLLGLLPPLCAHGWKRHMKL